MRTNSIYLVLGIFLALAFCGKAEAKMFKDIPLKASAILAKLESIPIPFARNRAKKTFLKNFDENNDGKLEGKAEFEKIETHFRRFDKDKNGILKRHEFKAAIDELKRCK